MSTAAAIEPHSLPGAAPIAAKLGAICYIAWGLWHLPIVWSAYQATLAMPAAPVQMRLQQNAFHILFFILTAIVVGAFFNWRNSRAGYWANLITIGWTEIGLLLIFILPGALAWLPTGFIGPMLWAAAVAFSTYAYVTAPGPILR